MRPSPSSLVLSITLLYSAGIGRAALPEALKAVTESGVKGGLIVHVGRNDGDLISSLRINDSYVVQGLDTDPGRIAKIRKTIQRAGLEGKVTVRGFDGANLPYIDNMVNLLIMPSGAGRVTQHEIMRVLTPGGTAVVAGEKTVKPSPGTLTSGHTICTTPPATRSRKPRS